MDINDTNDPNLWVQVWTKVSSLPQYVSDSFARSILNSIERWDNSQNVVPGVTLSQQDTAVLAWFHSLPPDEQSALIRSISSRT